jgi:enoyl-CoA hydratase/carnithine racemase
MGYKAIIFEENEGYGVITLNQPERLNAIGKEIVEEIKQVLHEVLNNNKINVLIFTGAPRTDGRPCFCSGANLKDIMERGFLPKLTPLTALRSLSTGARRDDREGDDGNFWELVAYFPKITIAAIDGICSAGGLELALVCDIIIASETARIGDLHMKNMGGVGGAAVTVNLARRIGVSKAIDMVCTSEFIDGKEAHRINLANYVYAPDKMMDGARELAKKIGGMRPEATMLVKAACNSIYNMDYRSSWRFADACSSILEEPPENVPTK